jgi:hypothetical protein
VIVTILSSVLGAWRRADLRKQPEAGVHLAAALTLIAFILEMTTDNAVVNIFVTAPLGLMLGASMGARRAKQFAIGHPIATLNSPGGRRSAVPA